MLESALRKKIRKTKIQKAILGSLYVAGVLSVAVLAPNVLSALNRLSGNKRKMSGKYAVSKAIDRLKEKGLIHFEKNHQGTFARLTAEGEQTLDLLEKKEFKISVPPKWDGKWRIIIFDIPEKRKKLRDTFRDKLMKIGFLKLQGSVWVYPHDCEEIITLLKTDFKVGKDILYVIADSIENASWIKRHFSLN